MDSDKTQDEFISQLYHDMFDFLSMYAMCRLIDPSSAEEAIQDTFLTAWVKKDDLASSPNPRGWLVNTLKKTIYNRNRSRARWNKRLVPFLAIDENAAASTNDADFNLMYRDLLGSEDFKLLKKIILEKYPLSEAAEELNISVEACKKRVQRAKKKLREILDKLK
jgi:RNA polymerase sigma-70 factor (ECF subfamily)